ncbi:hypothetical protein [Pseudobacteroides cellulosolvens]|uniref:hypothetical protein n=1 Tax=Pseudobacteroides cellulosolvens TaxID=35825 RepID=UPI001364B441|nr:hypothetical protein [Pseudobacteroides cellulosolvens]
MRKIRVTSIKIKSVSNLTFDGANTECFNGICDRQMYRLVTFNRIKGTSDS